MKIAIISDLHFDERNDWNRINKVTDEMIKRIHAKLKSNESIIFVVLGDIIDKCGIGDNSIKFNEAGKLINKLSDAFNNVYFHFIPGNHEVKDFDVKEFNTFCKKYSSKQDFEFTINESIYCEKLERINLIFTDSTLTRNYDLNGKIDLKKLKQFIDESKKNLIFMHHPPCEAEGADREVLNSEALIDICANFIFYGHQHGSVKLPDFLNRGTDIHSVGALFKDEDGVKNEFLLLDITDDRIQYARRYRYTSTHFNSYLMFPQKDNLQSHKLKLDTPKATENFINRTYKVMSNDGYDDILYSVIEKFDGIDEVVLLKNANLIQLLGKAGFGKTYSMINMYNLMIEDQDYFPVWLSLRNSNYENIKECLNYAQNHTIDNKTPILFFDGLDEMKNEYIDEFTRDIGSAINGDFEVKVVVSMRSNYHMTINRFEKYELMPLSQRQIEQIAANNDIKNIEDFMIQIVRKASMDLAQNPFYLFEMIKLYLRNNSLPKRKELFKHMIKIRFRDGDERHKCDYSKSLMVNEFELISRLKNLSFFISAIQEYSIENRKYTQIIESNIREQFQKTGLITNCEKYPELYWEFEHMNFNEYLTADLISEVNFDDLLEIITCDTKHKKLRPSWSNIVGFILTLRQNTDLTEWLVENAVDELCELQPDSLTVDDRNLVFNALFSECSKKGIPIYAKYQGNKLAKYFQSIAVINYLIERLEEYKNDCEILSSFYFLQYCTEFYNKEPDFLNLIKTKYLGADIPENIVMRAIKLVSAMANELNFDAVCEIISLVISDLRKNVISATCALIAKTNTSDSNAPYLLKILSNIDELEEDYSARKNLIEAIGKFEKVDNILNGIETLSELQNYIRMFNVDELFLSLVKSVYKCEEEFSEVTINKLVDIFIKCILEYKRSKYLMIRDCFHSLGITAKVFNIVISKKLDEKSMLFFLEAIMDESLSELLINSYDTGEINLSLLKWYAQRLLENSIIYNLISEAIYKKTGAKLERVKSINWEQINKEGTQRYFNSLYDKVQFQTILAEVIEYYDDNTLCSNLLNDSFHNVPHERKDLHCMVTALLHSNMEETPIKDFMSQVDWESFSVYQIVHIMKQNDNVEISQTQQEIIEMYYTKMLYDINFEENPTDDYFIYIAKQIIFFLNRFSFEITDEKLLEFIVLPWYVFESSTSSGESEALKFVEKRMENKDLLNDRIICNIQARSLNPYAMQTHIFYCLENNLEIAVDISTEFLKQSNNEQSSLQNSAIEYLIAIKGQKYVDDLVHENMDEHLLRYLSIKLTENNTKLRSLLEEKNRKSDDKLLFLEELIRLNSVYALETYIKLAKEKERIPDEHKDSSLVPEATHAIRDIADIKLLDYIGELLVLSLTEEFKDKDTFGLFSSSIGAIRNLSSINPVSVKTKLEKLIEDNPTNGSLTTNCNYYIGIIDKQINIYSDTPWEENKALDFIKKINQDHTFI